MSVDFTVSNLTEFFASGAMSREMAAKTLGISRGYLSQIEHGKRRIPLPLALRVRELTGVPLESLLPRSAESSAA